MVFNRKKPTIFLIGLLIIIIGVGTFYSFFSQTPKGIKSQDLPQPSIAPVAPQIQLTYSFSGNLSLTKTSASVYEVTPATSLNADTAKTLAASFGFTEEPQLLDDVRGTVYLFTQGNTHSLLIYPNPLRIEYSNSAKPSEKKASEQQLITTGSDFLQSFGSQFAHFSVSQAKLEYMASDFQSGLYRVNNPSEASFVQLSYNLILDNNPIIPKDRQNYPIELVLNLDGSVQKATVTLIPNQITSIGTTDLTKPADALAAINAGGGVIANLSNPNTVYTEVAPGSISTATLNKIELVYIYDNDLSMLQPYYRFSGAAQTKDGQTIDVEVLITALPQQVFKK